MTDTIKKFSKHKGYESLPRELLQSKDLTLEAIGLLANISSYPDTWVLRKTELRTRFKNGTRMVDRIWNELVENNYIVQFRKRVGRSYEYRYFFNVEPFTYEEIQDMLLHNFDDNFVLYHKDMQQEKFQVKDLNTYIFCDNKDKLDLTFWTSPNANPTEDDKVAVPSSLRFGHPNLDFPKRKHSKLITKEINTKDIKNNNNIYTQDEIEAFKELAKDRSNVGYAIKFLISTELDLDIAMQIGFELAAKPHLAIPELMVEQMSWTNHQTTMGKIYSYANYFIMGLEMRFSGYESNVSKDQIDDYYSNVMGNKWDNVQIPIINLSK